MKCKACGYIYDHDYSGPDWKEAEIGDEEFIQIYGTFFINDKYSYYDEKIQIGLYICPKCNTVVADVNY